MQNAWEHVKVSEYISDKCHIQRKIEMPDKMPEDMSEYMPDRMPDRVPEYMPHGEDYVEKSNFPGRMMIGNNGSKLHAGVFH